MRSGFRRARRGPARSSGGPAGRRARLPVSDRRGASWRGTAGADTGGTMYVVKSPLSDTDLRDRLRGAAGRARRPRRPVAASPSRSTGTSSAPASGPSTSSSTRSWTRPYPLRHGRRARLRARRLTGRAGGDRRREQRHRDRHRRLGQGLRRRRGAGGRPAGGHHPDAGTGRGRRASPTREPGHLHRHHRGSGEASLDVPGGERVSPTGRLRPLAPGCGHAAAVSPEMRGSAV